MPRPKCSSKASLIAPTSDALDGGVGQRGGRVGDLLERDHQAEHAGRRARAGSAQGPGRRVRAAPRSAAAARTVTRKREARLGDDVVHRQVARGRRRVRRRGGVRVVLGGRRTPYVLLGLCAPAGVLLLAVAGAAEAPAESRVAAGHRHLLEVTGRSVESTVLHSTRSGQRPGPSGRSGVSQSSPARVARIRERAPGRDRTDTRTLLRGLPLPIGLRGRPAHASGGTAPVTVPVRCPVRPRPEAPVGATAGPRPDRCAPRARSRPPGARPPHAGGRAAPVAGPPSPA